MRDVIFGILGNNKSTTIGRDEFWSILDKKYKRNDLTISDENIEIQILFRPYGIILRYLNKEEQQYLISIPTYLSADFVKKVVLSFCASETEWKNKLDWKEASSKWLTILLKRLGYFLLVLSGLFLLYSSINNDNYMGKIFVYLTTLGIPIFLILALLNGVILLGDLNNLNSLNNFEILSTNAKLSIIGETILFVIFALLFIFEIFGIIKF